MRICGKKEFDMGHMREERMGIKTTHFKSYTVRRGERAVIWEGGISFRFAMSYLFVRKFSDIHRRGLMRCSWRALRQRRQDGVKMAAVEDLGCRRTVGLADEDEAP